MTASAPLSAQEKAHAQIEANVCAGEANLDECDRNIQAILANVARIKGAPWRLWRNRQLLRENWRLLNRNKVLLAANNLILTHNAAIFKEITETNKEENA